MRLTTLLVDRKCECSAFCPVTIKDTEKAFMIPAPHNANVNWYITSIPCWIRMNPEEALEIYIAVKRARGEFPDQ